MAVLFYITLNQIKFHWAFIVGLDYQNPYLSPFDELQKFKTHPKIKPYFEMVGVLRRKSTSRRGISIVPKLSVPGGLIVDVQL